MAAMTGDYNANSKFQAAGITSVLPLVEQVVRSLAINSSEPFIAVDYGCSHGKNSVPIIGAVYASLSTEHNPSPRITYFMNDLPSNDWEAVHKTTEPISQKHPSLKIEHSKISFVSQALPSSSVQFGFSSTAMHWLSKIPSNIKGFVTPKYGDHQEPLWVQQAEDDWRSILQARGNELAVGGKCLFSIPAQDDSGRIDNIGSFKLLNEVLTDFLRDKIITQDQYENMVVPAYQRSRKEFVLPFQHGNYCSLEVEYSEIWQIPHPSLERYKQNRISLEDYATEKIGNFRGYAHFWLERVFDISEVQKIYDAMRIKFLEGPEKWESEISNMVLVLKKV